MTPDDWAEAFVSRRSEILSYERASSWPAALNILATMPQDRFFPDVVCYCSVAGACSKQEEWSAALALLSFMGTSRITPNLYGYNSVLVACAQCSSWLLALDILSQLIPRQILPDVVSYSSFISACSIARRWERALSTIDGMAQSQVAPNRFTYSGAIRCCEGANTWQIALHFLWAMRDPALDPDVVCFTSAIKACENAEQWSAALTLLDHMLLCTVSPNEFTCSSLVSACERASQRCTAVCLFKAMVSMSVDADLVACSAAITACARIAAWTLAISIYASMAERSIKPNEYTYSGAADACEKGFQWKSTPELLALLNFKAAWRVESMGRPFPAALVQEPTWLQELGFRTDQPHKAASVDKTFERGLAAKFGGYFGPSNDQRAPCHQLCQAAHDGGHGSDMRSFLDQGDFVSLRRVMADGLVEELRQTHGKLSKGLDYELREVFQLGIFHAMVQAEELGGEAVSVTPLLRVTEKYTLQKDPSVWWEVRRLHKWTFKRHLPDEDGNEASDWHIVSMDKRRWRPPGLKDEDVKEEEREEFAPAPVMRDTAVYLLSLAGLAAPFAALFWLTPDELSVQLLFMMLCCGVGLAAGVDSCRSSGQETLLPQDTLQGTVRLKEDLGVTYDEHALIRDHVTEMKYLSFLLFALRLAVNIKALWRNMMVVCLEDLPLTVGSAARVLEAGIFLEHLCKLPCEILSCICGIHASPSQCVGTVKTLAGFSAMRFVRFLNKRHIFGALRKIAADPNILKGCYLVIIGILYSLVLAGFGLSVLLTKLHGLDIKAMESAGVVGLFQKAWAALVSGGLPALMATNLMELVEFTNQVASAMNIREEEMHSLLSFLLGRNQRRAQAYMDIVMLNFMKLPRWSSRLVAMITFDAEGLQRLVRDSPAP
ncbi:unnamed protein product [Symbiodinium necroappetens]|uniref:Pentatricopeptide repeat-containing protein, chloroplastic n=1 Tax=Symbiodinium necroappetens TaxID=1628268 RepID=A0A813CA83_9DINO|nr:unnamed protein product [Symbiodinium necroappetens]